MKQGLLIILSGFSGSGKGTIMKRLLEKYDNYALSVSATTRGPVRAKEKGWITSIKQKKNSGR